ncbi:uncharacterized protein L201_002884 [Kwoniella dendrophila CBS 6074]|uniref:REJ domain-containing protein n=1 Tax=Kwoniella dendrophila CBS 6074 TaxID=1295534 RepID=A0AAX4JRB2_9TREE
MSNFAPSSPSYHSSSASPTTYSSAETDSEATQSTSYTVDTDYISYSSPTPLPSSESSTSIYSNSIINSGSYKSYDSTSNYNYGIRTDFTTFVGDSTSYNPSPSSSLINSNSTDSQDAQNHKDSDEGGHHPSNIIIAIISTIVTCVIVGVIGCCWYRRRRRRLNSLPGNTSNRRKGKARFVIDESKLNQIDIQALPLPQQQQPRFSQMDLDNILVSQQRNSQSPFNHPPINNDNSNNNNNNNNRSSSTRASTRRDNESLYTDNSEFDMLAQDGSSYARTLSTYSEGINSEYSERDLGGSYVPQQQQNQRPRLEINTTDYDHDLKSPQDLNSNPNSNPNLSTTLTRVEYNQLNSALSSLSSGSRSTPISSSGFRSGNQTPRQQLLSPQLNWTSSSSSSSPNNTSTFNSSRMQDHIRQLISPFVDSNSIDGQQPQIQSPSISPISTSSTNRSWRTEDEQLIMSHSQSQSSTYRSSQRGRGQGNDLERGITIVRHIDGGAIFSDDNALQDDDASQEVHLPPSYRELYPQNR